MEASQAGEAADAQGQEAEGQEAPESQPNDAVMQRLEEIASQIGPIKEAFESAGEEPEESEEKPDSGFFQQEQPNVLYNEFGEPVDPQTGQAIPEPGQIDPQQLQSFIQEQIQQGVQKAVEPIVQQQQQQRVMQEADALEQEFTELANPEIAGKTVEQARQLAEQMGQPELAAEPQFVRMAYLAGKAEQLVGSETPAGTDEGVQLEGGGGAVPGAGEEEDPAMRIVRAGGNRSSVLPGLM